MVTPSKYERRPHAGDAISKHGLRNGIVLSVRGTDILVQFHGEPPEWMEQDVFVYNWDTVGRVWELPDDEYDAPAPLWMVRYRKLFNKWLSSGGSPRRPSEYPDIVWLQSLILPLPDEDWRHQAIKDLRDGKIVSVPSSDRPNRQSTIDYSLLDETPPEVTLCTD